MLNDWCKQPQMQIGALLLGLSVGCGDGTPAGAASTTPGKSGESKGSASAKDNGPAPEGPPEFKQYNAGADLLKLPSKAGESCPSTGLRVISKTKMLACTEGKPAEEHECKGPKGVTLDSGAVIPSCDISKNKAGDKCNILVASSGCDGKQRVTCDVDLGKADALAMVAIKTCAKNCVLKKEGDRRQLFLPFNDNYSCPSRQVVVVVVRVVVAVCFLLRQRQLLLPLAVGSRRHVSSRGRDLTH